MIKLIFQLIAAITSLWLADKYVPGVELAGGIQTLVLVGIVLGLINFFVKPLLKAITFPLRILTLGLFSLILNMAIIWVVDVLFAELNISGLLPLFLTSVIFFVLNFLLVRD
jgi:putative membrane protein